MKEYTVQRVLGGDVGVEDAIWKGIPALSVNCFPWPAFEKKITTTAKLASTASGLLIHFETDERPLLAQKTENNSQVCEDSCLEFFFRTEDTLKYINLEINPLGTIHADFDREPIPVDARQLRLVSCITPEKWILQYEVPFSLIEKYFGSVGSAATPTRPAGSASSVRCTASTAAVRPTFSSTPRTRRITPAPTGTFPSRNRWTSRATSVSGTSCTPCARISAH